MTRNQSPARFPGDSLLLVNGALRALVVSLRSSRLRSQAYGSKFETVS